MKRFFLFTFVLYTFIANGQSIVDHDLITFETPYDYLHIDSSSQNIWQIGTPNKTIFQEALSPTQAILTDTSAFYPVNNYSYFDVLIGQFNYEEFFPQSVALGFNYKIDTDTLKDGLYITFSTDNGENWYNVIEQGASPNECWDISPAWEWAAPLYALDNTLYNGENGVSGRSEGWQSSDLIWTVSPVRSECLEETDTMIIRFNFISDSLDTQKEGCMIDDIRLYTYFPVGVDGITVSSPNFKISPNPLSSRAKIELDDTYKSVDFQLFSIAGKLIQAIHYEQVKELFFDKKGLGSGLYIVKIKFDDKKIATQKLLIE